MVEVTSGGGGPNNGQDNTTLDLQPAMEVTEILI